MKLQLLLSAFVILASLLSLTVTAQDQCDDADYAVLNQDLCGFDDSVVVGCDNADFAVLNQDECSLVNVPADCSDADFAVLNQDLCGVEDFEDLEVVGCDDADFAVLNQELCGVEEVIGFDCDDADFAVLNQDLCGVEDEPEPINTPPEITLFVPEFFDPSSTFNVDVIATDSDGVAQIELSYFIGSTASITYLFTFDCNDQVICEHTFQVTSTTSSNTVYTFTVKAIDSFGAETEQIKIGQTTSKPAPVTKPKPKAPKPVTPVVSINNPTTIEFLGFPFTADADTNILFQITATDSDGVDRIELLDQDNNVIEFDSCGNVIVCTTKTFIVRVPNAFSTAYQFIARVFDSLDNPSVTESITGTTNPEPIPEPEPEPTPPDQELDDVRFRIPSDDIFVASFANEADCVSPGTETYLFASIKNKADKTIKDIKITTVVQDLSIRAVSGPFSIREGESVSRFPTFIVPDDAKPGTYWMRIAVTTDKDSIIKHRSFEVDPSC